MRITRLTTLSAIFAAAISNAGCNSDLGDYRAGGCPPLIAYSAAEQPAAADEIRRHPNGSLAKMVRDYGKLRKACRVK